MVHGISRGGALVRLSVGVLLLALLSHGSLRAVEDESKHGIAKEHTSSESKVNQAKPQKNGEDSGQEALAHVLDSNELHFFDFMSPIHLPKLFGVFQVTKFMVLELIAALVVMVLYIPMARRLREGQLPRGAWDNLFESFLAFIRDQVARPGIGEHDADHHVPFLWTLFLFILVNNLLGMMPFGASPTANIYMTGALALCVFFAIHGSAVAKMGFGHYLQSMWPHIEVPFPLGLVITPLVFVIEIIGALVRNAVLAVRLFANMFAGHTVLATIMLFIVVSRNTGEALWATITLSSVLGVLALSLLEIFVAFLQAYIFVFLTALFMGMALHPQH
jgi:F-type H+-transporting ATPase subunit a